VIIAQQFTAGEKTSQSRGKSRRTAEIGAAFNRPYGTGQDGERHPYPAMNRWLLSTDPTVELTQVPSHLQGRHRKRRVLLTTVCSL